MPRFASVQPEFKKTAVSVASDRSSRKKDLPSIGRPSLQERKQSGLGAESAGKKTERLGSRPAAV
jgi:hypothetical protein